MYMYMHVQDVQHCTHVRTTHYVLEPVISLSLLIITTFVHIIRVLIPEMKFYPSEFVRTSAESHKSVFF